MEYNKLDIGKRLKEVRVSLGLSQTQAGTRAGISQDMVSRYEKGKSEPSTEYLYWAAGEGGATIDWILTGEDPEEFKERIEEAQKRYGLNLSYEEREIIELYREATIEGKAAVKAVLENYRPQKRNARKS